MTKDQTITLTDAEREELGLIVARADNEDQSLGEWHPCENCPGGPCPCSGRPWLGEEMTAAVERILAAHVAAAWDEGFDAGERDVFDHERDGDWNKRCIANPYREQGGGR